MFTETLERPEKDRIQARGTTSGISNSRSVVDDISSADSNAKFAVAWPKVLEYAAAEEPAAARCTIGNINPAMKHKYLRSTQT
jgi:hypothetical protein